MQSRSPFRLDKDVGALTFNTNPVQSQCDRKLVGVPTRTGLLL